MLPLQSSRLLLLQRSPHTLYSSLLQHPPPPLSAVFHLRSSLSPSPRGPGRANQMMTLATRSPGAGAVRPSLTTQYQIQQGQQNNRTPPPPSHQHLSYSSSPSPSSLLSSNSNKVSSRRTAQIARHLTTSSTSSSSPTGPAAPQSPSMASPYTVRKVAAAHTHEHRVYIEKDGVPVSPFHDIPLYANQEQGILNMVVEIPRWTNAKLEVCFVTSTCSVSFPHCCKLCITDVPLCLTFNLILTYYPPRSPRRSS